MAEEVVQASAQAENQGANPAAGSEATPSPVELKDDILVRLPNNKDAVKFGDWFKGYQAQHTKATQSLSKLQADFERVKQEREQERRELDGFRQAAGRQPSTPSPTQTLAEQLKGLPYLKGEEGAALLGRVQEEIQARDQKFGTAMGVIKMLAEKLQQTNQLVESMNNRFRTQDFDAKIGKYREDLGLPAEAKDFLTELYLAYEGDDLDSEFPNIARSRWEQIQSLVRAADRAKVAEARKNRFVPGKGGVGSPSKPLDTSRMSPRELADAMWPGIAEEA